MVFEPNYHISLALLETLKRIAVLVADLNKYSPDETVTMRLMDEAQAQSVYASTTIEGNPLALTAVKALLKRHPRHLRQSEQEILNYNTALTELQTKSFSERTVLGIQKTVMKNLLVKEKTGAYRKEPVFIHDPRTREVIFLPPDHADVPKLMRRLFAFVKANRDVDPVILAALFHKQFVLIHPFIDGNGRSVRLASTLLLRDLGINLFKLLSFENYYNQNVTRYFMLVGEKGNYYDLNVDFTPWLEYFAEGILSELRRLEKMLERNEAKILRLKDHHKVILNFLKEQGSMTDREYARLVDRAKATRALDFKYLLNAGLIDRRGKGPATYYVLAE
ncbi:MAG: Fic family protein [Trueperaceae bacterium]|nr:MAG: Fic family protein [Trueperaceae bacterium]